MPTHGDERGESGQLEVEASLDLVDGKRRRALVDARGIRPQGIGRGCGVEEVLSPRPPR